MKFSHRLAFGALSVASLAMAMTTPALAASPVSEPVPSVPTMTTTGDIEVISSGETADGGWVEFTGTGMVTIDETQTAGGMSTQLILEQEVGGGRWQYGSLGDFNGKHCISKYYHETKNHGSTAVMDAMRSRVNVNKKQWSNADVHDWTRSACHAYWHSS